MQWRNERIKRKDKKKTPNLWNVSQASLSHELTPQYKLVVWEIIITIKYACITSYGSIINHWTRIKLCGENSGDTIGKYKLVEVLLGGQWVVN